MKNKSFSTSDMFLVFEDHAGNLHYQPWSDVTEMGTLIEGDDAGDYEGDDMTLVGWTTTLPE